MLCSSTKRRQNGTCGVSSESSREELLCDELYRDLSFELRGKQQQNGSCGMSSESSRHQQFNRQRAEELFIETGHAGCHRKALAESCFATTSRRAVSCGMSSESSQHQQFNRQRAEELFIETGRAGCRRKALSESCFAATTRKSFRRAVEATKTNMPCRMSSESSRRDLRNEPEIDAAKLDLHVRKSTGTRITPGITRTTPKIPATGKPQKTDS